MGYIMPLLLGISAGWLGSVGIEYYLTPKRAALEFSMAARTANAQNKTDQNNGLNDFISANPFSISAFPVINTDAPVVMPTEEPKIEVKNSFSTATLAGTFPEIGAFMQDNTNNRVDFIAVGDSFDVYRLTEVLYDRAIFRDQEDNDITKFFYITDNSTPANTQANIPSQPVPVHQPVVMNQMTAVPGGQPGVLTRADLDKLMMNPFDEMKKFRMRPKFEGNEPIGIEIQWIQNDSILGKLGVQKSDVIKSVNGIAIKNMGDITNAVNSLMNGTRFDVEVLRGGAPTNLIYQVR
jgi:type II secretory pathway component PulC